MRPISAAGRVRTNFIGSFKDKLKQELEKNKELQETIKGIKEDKTLTSAAEAARDMAKGLQDKVNQAGSSVAQAAEQAGKATESAGEMAQKVRERVAAEARATSSTTADGAAGTGAASKEEPAASSKGERAAGEEGGSKPLPLYQQAMADAAALFSTVSAGVRRTLSREGAAAPPPPPEGGGEGVSSNAVVVKQPSFWEKTFNFASESPFMQGFSRIFGAAGDTAGGLGDRIFGETEQAEAIGELRTLVPDFTVDEFMKHDVEHLVPQVLKAYLVGDAETLRRTCRDAAYGMLHKSIMEREAHQLVMDQRILHMSDPELEALRFVGGQPTPVISFEAHQLNCVRSKLTNAVVEGDEDDIRAVHYLFALQLNESAEAPRAERWQVTELAVRGRQSVY